MVDQWIKQELQQQLSRRQLVVVLDPEGQLEQLVPAWVQEGNKVVQLDHTLAEEWRRVKEELFLRVNIEKAQKVETIIYSQRPKKQLSFLYDYTETHGVLDFSNTEEWLRQKLFKETGLQIQLTKEELLTAAKASVGKDIKWWKAVIQGLADVVNLEQEILPFIANPETWEKSKSAEELAFVRQKLFAYIGQPQSDKAVSVLANEVVEQLLHNVALNKLADDKVWYTNWLDSNQYINLLKQRSKHFALPSGINHWEVDSNHCFEEIDRKQLRDVVANLHNAAFKTKYHSIINKRGQNSRNPLVPTWWKDISTVLSFDPSRIAKLYNLQDVVGYYVLEYQKLDRAIRNLYQAFLNEADIIKPIQEYYQGINQELIDKWFTYKGDYITNQQGFLVELIKNTTKKIAVIVGDGVRWEIANAVAEAVDSTYEVQKQVMLADLPSETEHNMSALYVGNNRVLKLQSDREKELVQLTGKEITFKKLVDINATIQDPILVLTYKDIDSAGEKLQLDAIKLFAEFEKVLNTKIEELLRAGYEEVHLVTDHGFVLTGLLDEADKIEPNATGKKEVHERFIRTVDKQSGTDWIAFDKKYAEYNFVYASKSHRPFKSKGVYGFSHGGFTPQEIVIPNFVFKKIQEVNKGLNVEIVNKKELAEVTGELFGIKLQAATSSGNLFSASRKIQIMLYANGTNFSSSNILTIEPGVTQSIEFSFNGNKEVQAILLDATTQEQLDTVKITKSNARDLGGLL